jgi:hypothetical protein
VGRALAFPDLAEDAIKQISRHARCSPMSVMAQPAAARFIAQRPALGAFLVAR